MEAMKNLLTKASQWETTGVLQMVTKKKGVINAVTGL